MKQAVFISMGLLLFGHHELIGACPVESTEPVIINDFIANAQIPFGLARFGEHGLIATFNDGGDLEPGAKTYFVRSEDLGLTWSEPYEELSSENPSVGMGAGVTNLPNGEILLILIEQTHHSDDLSWNAVFKPRTSKYILKKSADGGKTYVDLGVLPNAPQSNGGVMGTVVELANGDIIMPAYQYPGNWPEQEGNSYGSGFFRSRDGGKTWSKLEIAFRDPPTGREKKCDFSESSYVVREDGSLVAYARIDSEIYDEGPWQSQGNNLWRIESQDNGHTWSEPVETSIGGIFPAIIRLDKNCYLLVCGDRHASPTRKIHYYTSTDAVDFEYAGSAPYLRTEGECRSSATGGAQAIVRLNDDEVFLTYYAADPRIGTRDNTYIEGCRIRLKP